MQPQDCLHYTSYENLLFITCSDVHKLQLAIQWFTTKDADGSDIVTVKIYIDMLTN
jgi:hypothetical protein